MQSSKQFTVFLDNKPGRLAKVLADLAKQKVNITAMSVMDHREHSVLRFVPDPKDIIESAHVIEGINAHYSETEVLLVELKNNPGALAHVCELLAAEHIGVDYAYCSSGGRNGKVLGIFKVTNPDKATKVLGNSTDQASKRRLVNKRPMFDKKTGGKK